MPYISFFGFFSSLLLKLEEEDWSEIALYFDQFGTLSSIESLWGLGKFTFTFFLAYYGLGLIDD